MIIRYEIQVCDLDDTLRKSEVTWKKVAQTFTLTGARSRFWDFASQNTYRTIYRIYDRETKRAVDA